MQEQKEDILENLERRQKIKKLFIISIISVAVVIIIFLSISAYFYFKSPEKTLGIGANIENALLGAEGKTAYIKLKGGSLDKNITKIKFIFTDAEGREFIYKTSEGIKEIEVPFKRSFWDWLFGRQFIGNYDYEIGSDEAGLIDFSNINKVSVLFEYKTETGDVIETPVLDTQTPTNRTTTPGGGDGEEEDEETPTPTPTPTPCTNDTGCTSIGSFCDGTLPYNCSLGADGCLDRINGNDCSLEGKICENGSCVLIIPNCLVNSKIMSECLCQGIERGSGYCCSYGWQENPCDIFEADYYVDYSIEDCTTYNVSTRSCGNGDKIAFNKIQEAANVLTAGQTVAAREGRYHEEIVPQRGGNETAGYITYRSYPGEKVSIDGSVSLNGWTKCSSQSECFGNPNWSNVYYTSVPKYMYPEGIILYEKDRIAKVAMYPDQTDYLYIDQVSEFKTFDRNGTCSNISIKDPEYLTSENLPYFNQSYIAVWQGNNAVNFKKILNFDPANNEVFFDQIYCVDSYNEYAIINNILALSRPGEFYLHNFSTDAKIYYWPYESINNKITYSDLGYGFNLRGNAYIIIEGFEIKKMASGPGVSRFQGEGIASYLGASGTYSNRIIKDNVLYGLKASAITLSYCSNCLVENNTIYDVYGRGIIVTGSWAGNKYIYNSSINKNYLSKIQSTAIDYYAAIDSNITNNIVANCSGQHGNGITVYENSTNVLIKGNRIYNTTRPMTFNNGQYHIIRNNFADKNSIYCWGSPQENYLVEQNTFLGGISCGSSVHQNFTLRNNIAGGISNNLNNFTYKNNLYISLSWDRQLGLLDPSELYYPYPEKLFANTLIGDYRPVSVSPACNMSTTGSYVGAFPCVSLEGCEDKDNDGYYAISPTCEYGLATDCDDNNPNIYPGAIEICGNGIDEDCVAGDLKCLEPGAKVLDLKFENNLEDSSGYNNYGIWFGNASYSDGEVGLGLNLSGIHPHYVKVPNLNFTLKASDNYNFSVMAWAKNKNPTVANQNVWSGGLGSVRISGNLFRFCQNGNLCSNQGGNVQKDIWYHLTVTVDGTNWTYYINGTRKISQDGGSSLINSSSAYQFYIGGGQYSGDWNGSIDEVMIYNRALNETEIQQIYCAQGGDAGFCSQFMPSLSPFTQLWNFLKSILTGKTGNAILTGKITGNAAGDGSSGRKSFVVFGVFAAIILIIIVAIIKIKKSRKKSGKRIGRR